VDVPLVRPDDRPADRLRPCSIRPEYLSEPHGSALIEWGLTKVLCTALIQPGVPAFLEGRGEGWLKAEYAMLPGSSDGRKPRGMDGRAREIGRLIGRSLRQAVNRKALGPRTIFVDCDVLQAHGGTRTASVTGAWVALALACRRLGAAGALPDGVVANQLAGVSVGLLAGAPVLDLDRDEDRQASADVNVVMNTRGNFIEIQGTAEEGDMSGEELDALLVLARKGCTELFAIQDEALKT
jgi:ribonuclease PH